MARKDFQEPQKREKRTDDKAVKKTAPKVVHPKPAPAVWRFRDWALI